MGGAGELIESIRRDAVALAAADLTTFAPQELGELLRAVERARAAVDAAANGVLDRFDAEGAAAYDGLRSTSSWLRQHCQMTGATVSRRVRTARALRSLPEVSDGFRTGRFSADQADLFARALNPRTAEAMANDESALARLADRLRPDDLGRELRGWSELVDTDGTEPDPGHRDRRLTFVQTLDGAWTGRIDLSAADGLVVHQAIEAMAERLYRSQEAGRHAGDGDAGRAVDEAGGSRAQRRADALVELVRRGCRPLRTGDQAPPGPGSPAADRSGLRVTLYLTLDAGDLESGRGADTLAGQHLGPAATDHLLCDGALARALVDPFDGAVLDLDRSRRVVSAAQRSALSLRDRGCSFPGCSAPPQECDAHHLVHWRHGGSTNLQNLALVCNHHHSLAHEGGWHVTMTATGPRWSRPDGRHVDRTPGWAHPGPYGDPPRRRRRRAVPDRRAGGDLDPGPDAAEEIRRARERAHALRHAA